MYIYLILTNWVPLKKLKKRSLWHVLSRQFSGVRDSSLHNMHLLRFMHTAAKTNRFKKLTRL